MDIKRDYFVKGQHIVTTKDKGSTDWTDNDRARRRPWGMKGMIIQVKSGHGVIYLVDLDNHPNAEWYEHEEVELDKDY